MILTTLKWSKHYCIVQLFIPVHREGWLEQQFLKYGAWIGSLAFTWELTRHVNSLAPTQIC